MLSGARTSQIRPAGGTLGVIPTRLASTRLPRKPLVRIAGRPLIEWVWQHMSSLEGLDELVVAADHPEIIETVEKFGGRAVLTRGDHPSGTDRVAEVAERPEFAGFGVIVNLQGDEPFLPAAAATEVVRLVRSGWDIGTAASRISEGVEWQDPSTVKVVRDDLGGAMYFSRAAIPFERTSGGEETSDSLQLRHIGVYGFSRASLGRAAGLAPHPLERREGLEQLRWLAAGLKIGVALVEGGAPGIDTEADRARAEEMLGGRESKR